MNSENFVKILLTRSKWVLLVALVLGIVCGVRTALTYANLRSDLEELLPQTAPSVEALEAARRRLPGLRHLGVVVDTGRPENAEAALRFLADLEQRIVEYPAQLVSAVRSGVSEERRFLETYALQFIEPADVRRLREAVEARHRWELGRAMDLGLVADWEDPAPEIPIRELEEKYAARAGGKVSFPNDRFLSADERSAVLVIQSASRETSLEADEELLARVQRDVEALGFPEAYAPGMRIGFAGDVATRVEEARGLAMDLGFSGAFVWVLVVGCIIWFYRSAAAIVILGVPVVLAALYTFGLAALPPLSIRHLNTNTAFLASILVGNGINSGIMLLARYQEELRHGQPLVTALTTGVKETFRPTLAAALAAAAAYASLALTDFRGFSQFGLIGGAGMLVSWLTSYLLIPILTSYLGANMGSRARQPLITPWVTSLAVGRPRLVLLAAGACTVLSVLGIGLRQGTWVETDFSRLRRSDSWVSGERYWGKRMDATLQRYLTPTVILADSEARADQVAEAARGLAERNEAGGLIASVRSASAVLPEWREESVEEARRLRAAVTPAMLGGLEARERARLEAMLSDAALRPLTAADVPATLAAGLRDTDGQLGRNVLVFPITGAQTWEAERIAGFARDLRAISSEAGEGVVATGPLLLSNDLIDAMRRDGPRATAVAFGVVLLVVAFSFRSFRLSAIAVGALIGGIVVMLGLAAWAGQRLNFSNFVALPLTFGISADYSLNVLQRYQSSSDLDAAGAETGGAVALCSATTVVGFGSLLVAQNGALFSFGALAVAGELAGLCTAALVLPAFLAWRARVGSEPSPAAAVERSEREA
jgi:predicted RND superfamily exporter protein